MDVHDLLCFLVVCAVSERCLSLTTVSLCRFHFEVFWLVKPRCSLFDVVSGVTLVRG